MSGISWGSVASVVAAATILGVPVATAAQQQKPQVRAALPQRSPERCGLEADDAEAVSRLARAISAALRALPTDRSTAEDIEATILYTISQYSVSPGVARSAIDQVGGGTAALRQAVSHVRISLLRSCGAGTAGLASPGYQTGTGFSAFSAPIVGIGGGSATYSR